MELLRFRSVTCDIDDKFKNFMIMSSFLLMNFNSLDIVLSDCETCVVDDSIVGVQVTCLSFEHFKRNIFIHYKLI
jgi:hypothetical protein